MYIDPHPLEFSIVGLFVRGVISPVERICELLDSVNKRLADFVSDSGYENISLELSLPINMFSGDEGHLCLEVKIQGGPSEDDGMLAHFELDDKFDSEEALRDAVPPVIMRILDAIDEDTSEE